MEPGGWSGAPKRGGEGEGWRGGLPEWLRFCGPLKCGPMDFGEFPQLVALWECESGRKGCVVSIKFLKGTYAQRR